LGTLSAKTPTCKVVNLLVSSYVFGMKFRQENQNATKKLDLMSVMEPIQGEIKGLDELMIEGIPTKSSTGSKILSYAMNAGGKRLRPALFFLSSDLVDYRGEFRSLIACVGEYVHLASLLHDDVVDGSHQRRHQPTCNSKWGNDKSVLAGDLVYSTACEHLCQTGIAGLVGSFARSIRLMSDGELIQLDELYNPQIKRETYFRIIEYKTAVLLGTICQAAGYLANLNDSERKKLYTLGLSIGISYQMVDDCLDYSAAQEKLGKPILSDLKNGKVTLPIIKLREVLPAEKWQTIADAISHKSVHQKMLKEIQMYLQEYKILDECMAEAKSYAVTAMDSISSFKDSESRSRFLMLVEALLFREF